MELYLFKRTIGLVRGVEKFDPVEDIPQLMRIGGLDKV